MQDHDTPETLSTEKQIKKIEEENNQLKKENQMLTDCILEISGIVYGGDK